MWSSARYALAMQKLETRLSVMAMTKVIKRRLMPAPINIRVGFKKERTLQLI